MIRDNFIDRTARKPSGKWAVKSYNNPRSHYRSFRVILNALRLNERDSYCEIGCGGGVLLNMALKEAASGAAIDHSEDMVQLAIENNRELHAEGKVEILQGNAEHLPWDANSFTACACANMFFFVEHPQAILDEVFRVLKPGGRFSMVTMGRGILGKVTFGLLFGLRTYSNKQMTDMLRQSGFHNVSIKTGFLGFTQECYGEKTTA